MGFATIVDEIMQQFTTDPNANVTISIDIQAQSSSGFDETVQRAVRENCNHLRFKNADFEGGEEA